jgi:hypothetical protein
MAHVAHRISHCIELGAMLKAKKAELGHGHFIAWFLATIEDNDFAQRAGFSLRRAQQFMRLSELHETNHLDLEKAATVKQAFQLAGILPPSDAETSTSEQNSEPQIFTKMVRMANMIVNTFKAKPIDCLDAQEREIWAAKLKPLATIYLKLIDKKTQT